MTRDKNFLYLFSLFALTIWTLFQCLLAATSIVLVENGKLLNSIYIFSGFTCIFIIWKNPKKGLLSKISTLIVFPSFLGFLWNAKFEDLQNSLSLLDIGADFSHSVVLIGEIYHYYIPTFAILSIYWRSRSVAETGSNLPGVLLITLQLISLFIPTTMVLSRVFALDITALLATSGILAATIGLALQPSLSNVLSGIFVSLERPFRRNEWISVGETLGLVLDTNWRATTLRTLGNVIVTVPNEIISKSMISNWSRPDEELMSKGFHVNHSLHFHPRHDPSQITAVISNTLKLIKPVDGRSNLDRQFIKFIDNDEFGLKFAIGYDCTDRKMEYSQRHVVLTEVHKALAHAGISMSSGKLFTSLTEDPGLSAVPHTFRKIDDFDPDLRGSMNPYNESIKNTSLMRTVPLFSSVSEDALEKIARECSRVIFGPAETIFQQDATGSSLFIIVDGVVSIEKTLSNNTVIKVGNLGVGEFFGEMALLTGEPRTATAISLTDTKLLKIESNSLKVLLDSDEEFLEKISKIYAHRLLMTEKLESLDLEISKELPSAIQRFKTRILAFLA